MTEINGTVDGLSGPQMVELPALPTAEEVEEMIERDPVSADPGADDRPPIDDLEPTPERAFEPACPYPAHRPTDWRGASGKVFCGQCHPRPEPSDSAAGAPAPANGGPAAALNSARVNLVERISQGVPERTFVPGANWIITGKRYLVPSPSGQGKSLTGLIIAVDVVEVGGTVAILDVENGEDEYARRLADVLEARDESGTLTSACEERLRYYAWPAVRTDWRPEEWAGALAGVDLVVLDSSRFMLSAAGLAEDSNDDYALFASAVLMPLSRAGIATVTLDNTGHDGDRARGASAKRDLNEVVYMLTAGEEFDRDQTGYVRLERKRSRFAELPAELHVPIGGGVYGPLVEEAAPRPADDDFRPTTLMERISEALEQEPGMTTNETTAAVKGKNDAKRLALRLLIEDGYVRVETHGQARKHFAESVYRAAADPKVEGQDG